MLLAEYLMRQRGVTQTSVSLQTGIARSTINRILRGDLPPYPKYQRAFAQVLEWPQDKAAELFEPIKAVV